MCLKARRPRFSALNNCILYPHVKGAIFFKMSRVEPTTQRSQLAKLPFSIFLVQVNDGLSKLTLHTRTRNTSTGSGYVRVR